jgi:hypothetical protein
MKCSKNILLHIPSQNRIKIICSNITKNLTNLLDIHRHTGSISDVRVSSAHENQRKRRLLPYLRCGGVGVWGCGGVDLRLQCVLPCAYCACVARVFLNSILSDVPSLSEVGV